MRLGKYAKVSDSAENKKNKVVISDESFAICEMIEELIDKIEHARNSLKR